jgi:hypothetical protein
MLCCASSALTSEETEDLMRAAGSGNEAYVSSCLSSAKQITVEARDRFGQTAAHWSAYRGKLHILKLLIEAGASMDTKDMDGRVTLHWAVRKERASCVHYLLQRGSPTDHRTKGTGETALHKAARQGSLDIVSMLCIAGARRDIVTTHNQTALDIAYEMRALETDYAEKQKKADEEERSKEDSKEVETKVEGGEDNDNEKRSNPTDRPKESPYVAPGIESEQEENNKFGPIVEYLETFTDDMINLKSLTIEEEESPKKRKRGKLKRKSTIYQDDAPMAEIFEEQLRSGSMKSNGGKSGGCTVQ